MYIRELGIDDIEFVKRTMLEIFSGEPWNDTWTDEQLHQYILELMSNKNSLSFGAYKDDILIGISLGKIKSWYEGTEYWIDEFGILPMMQQNGNGSAFMNEIEIAAAEKGIEYIVLLTERNVPAYQFYKRNGFNEKEETVFFFKQIH